MDAEELKKLPRSLRLLKMGRQKISKQDHNKRTDLIKSKLIQSKCGSTPSKKVPGKAQGPPQKQKSPPKKQMF